MGWSLALSGSVAIAVTVALAVAQPHPGVSDAPANPAPSLLAPAPDTTPLRIFVTADSRGHIDPCGCEKGQFGGLSRRGTLLGKARRSQDLTLDLGNFAAGQRPLDRLKFRYMLEGFEALRYDVLVPGRGELALGEDFEKAAATLKGPRVVCANLFRAKDGTRVFEPWTVRALVDGRRFAVIGITSPFEAVPPVYRVGPVEEALRDALSALAGKADAVIVAAYLEGKPALDLAAAFPKVALVLAGRVPKGSTELVRRVGAPAMFVGEYAQYVTWVDFAPELSAATGGQIWLGDGVPDDPMLTALLARHKAEAKAMGPQFARDALAAFRQEGRVGSSTCKECHPAEHAAWASSPHARAMKTLHDKNEERNPECLSCHLQDIVPEKADPLSGASAVGCEACHGGGARHIEGVRNDAGKVPLRLMARSASSTCGKCHDMAHSKKFDLTAYWQRVRHGPQGDGGRK